MNKDKRIIGRIIKRFKINHKIVCKIECPNEYSTYILYSLFVGNKRFSYFKLKMCFVEDNEKKLLKGFYNRGTYNHSFFLNYEKRQGRSESSNGALLYFWFNKILK